MQVGFCVVAVVVVALELVAFVLSMTFCALSLREIRAMEKKLKAVRGEVER